ncbi:MAG: efflux RND transporter permease subunit, partial [Lachnospiraceae bacterium]|nr:efflux RND transporter permease subunit [Lachnospiraceae bacterium]
MGITKFTIRRPVTALLIIASVIFFGIISFTKFSYELTPDLNMPMYIVATVYGGASPTDIDETISKKVEEKVSNLNGAKDIQVASMQNMSLVVVQYDYDQNMDQAYNDLKKEIDNVKSDFPEDAEDPYIVEMDINSMASMTLAVSKKNTEDIYNYVTNTFTKELDKLPESAEITSSGGRERYIKIALKPEMMARYNLDMPTLASIIKSADFTYPAGTLHNADRELSITTQVEYDTVLSLRHIPIITGNKRTLYLEDIADVRYDRRDATTIGRYNGEDCMIVSIKKNQRKSAIALSNRVKRTIKNLMEKDKNLEVTIILDQADNILDSLKNVFETMIIAIILSMLVIYLFFGDINASMIVGTSIPFSIMTSLSAMYLTGYSLNIITTSSLVAGVGMMVDNSIVVLEACFRAKDEYKGEELSKYIKAAIKATDTVGFSVFGSTLTTCVVFA